jgi:hypothetical protein
LAGIGAAIVALNAPAIISAATERSFAPFVVPASDGRFTTFNLANTIISIGRQVEALGPLTMAEAETVAGMIEDVINDIRPIGVRVRMLAPLDQVAEGMFLIIESGPGNVDVIEGGKV